MFPSPSLEVGGPVGDKLGRMNLRTDHLKVKKDIGRPIMNPATVPMKPIVVVATPAVASKNPRIPPKRPPAKAPPNVATRKNKNQALR